MFNSEPFYQSTEPRPPERIEEGAIISPDTRRQNRIPPGQTRTRKWPVLHYGRVPNLDLARWRFEITGLVKNPLKFTWQEFQELPRVKIYADFHCVTRWSRLDNVWEGVSIQELLKQAEVLPEANYVLAHGYDDGWTTNLPLSELNQIDVLVADLHDGKPITGEHGGPARLIVPRLYAWKSAKWLQKIELIAEDRPGFWEQGGYHMHGDPWTINNRNPDGERYRE